MIKRPLHSSHGFLAGASDEQTTAVDTAIGNNNGIAFLAQHAREVYTFDMQEQALQSTKGRLEKQEIHNAHLILDGRQHTNHHVSQSIRAAIFNLGYLPGADKTVITKPDTILIAMEKILEKLEVGGRLAIAIYYGHEDGDMEKDTVLGYVNQLDQRLFTIILYRPLNQINQSPFLMMIGKLKQSKES